MSIRRAPAPSGASKRSRWRVRRCGYAIVRLQGNDNLRGIRSVFRERGYDTKWIYGGYGYFDNMNAYFSGNGFTVVDRTVMQPEGDHVLEYLGRV